MLASAYAEIIKRFPVFEDRGFIDNDPGQKFAQTPPPA